MSHRKSSAVAALLLAVLLAAACGSGNSESDGQASGDVEGSCAKQKSALSEMYCRDDQELWACTQGAPDGTCEPAAASSNSFRCKAPPQACASVAMEIADAEMRKCPELQLALTARDIERIQSECNPKVEDELSCALGCFDQNDCPSGLQKCIEACEN